MVVGVVVLAYYQSVVPFGEHWQAGYSVLINPSIDAVTISTIINTEGCLIWGHSSPQEVLHPEY
jgi:hypothetical protein